MSNNVETTTTQEDWDDFFAPGAFAETAFDSMDQDDPWLRVAGEFGGGQKSEADQRLDETPFEYKGPPPGYIFDR